MLKKLLLSITSFCFLFLSAWDFPKQNTPPVEQTVTYFKACSDSFALATINLEQAIGALNSDNPVSLTEAKSSLVNCRNQYKRIAFFLAYFFPSATRFYNAAPVVEVEEPTLEFEEPLGLQQIESLLFVSNPYAEKKALRLQTEALRSSATDIKALLHEFEASDAQVLEALRTELIRVITLYIAGYDAPQLKTGITESYQAISSLQQVLQYYANLDLATAANLKEQIAVTLAYLKANPDFDSFNRLHFLTKFALPLQKQLGLFISDVGLSLNTNKILNYQAQNIFSANAFKVGEFLNDSLVTETLVPLGKKLFAENRLSGNNSRSCRSCHNPDLYFTDKLPQNMGMKGHSVLKRNTPTLLFASLQQSQFWDGRANNLTEQIETVLLSPEEMGGKLSEIQLFLKTNKAYQTDFVKAFPLVKPETLGTRQIAQALAAYVGTLNPYNSAFDKYMSGSSSSLSTAQINGFNLFTGKAQCATCHFMPLFNSVLPPDYKVTEYEIIGVTASDDLTKPQVDSDAGRFSQYPVKYYQGAFKTPTIRNVAETAPYMHNGRFKDLNKVLEFYNQGGGHGLGLTNAEQTLSGSPLKLTQKEMQDIIQFMQALTDSLPTVINATSKL